MAIAAKKTAKGKASNDKPASNPNPPAAAPAAQESKVQTQDLAVIESRSDISVSREPTIVLEEARKAARALKDVIASKPNPVIMNNKQYLEFEDWQTVAKFYGLAARVLSTSPITFGEHMGFEATAVVYNLKNDQEVSRAEAMCMNDEEKWSTRPKYEYHYVLKDGTTSAEDPGKDDMVWIPNPRKPGSNMPKRDRVHVGDEKVPLFQLRSMAQTRACAKAFRNCLAWVVVMAGYQGTPAEELTGATDQGHSGEQQQTKQTGQQQQQTGSQGGNGTGGTVYAIGKEHQALLAAMKDYYKNAEDINKQEIGEDEAVREMIKQLTTWPKHPGCTSLDQLSAKMAVIANKKLEDLIKAHRGK